MIVRAARARTNGPGFFDVCAAGLSRSVSILPLARFPNVSAAHQHVAVRGLATFGYKSRALTGETGSRDDWLVKRERQGLHPAQRRNRE
jgi:hypothetical protein